MQQLDLTLPTPEENLALDEALLDEAEAGRGAEVLRLWESERPMVVVGRGSHVAQEVDLVACRRDGVPVLRRTSGGGAIVSGPGCLMYAVVLSYALRPRLRAIDVAHRQVLETLAGAALRRFSADVVCRGTSDLALGELKFSGNSLRVRRTHLLYHGTLLYDFALEAIGRYLIEPPRQPDYRRRRPHGAFVTNLPAGREALARAVSDAWNAHEKRETWPERRVSELVREYGQEAWNLRH